MQWAASAPMSPGCSPSPPPASTGGAGARRDRPVRPPADARAAGAVAGGPGQRQPAHAGTGAAQPARQCAALCAPADPHRQHGGRRLAVPAGGG
ncbi:hypothetical protein G6F66_014602 [Rhizopus arrhizus]|nr:hypothetical protein G6F66_014602 [Rhizopus arrhizus]